MKLPRPWIPLDVPADVQAIRAELESDTSAWLAADGVGGSMIARRALLAPGGDGGAVPPRLAAWLARAGGPWSRVDVVRYAPGAHTPSSVDPGRAGRVHSRVLLAVCSDITVEAEGGRVMLAPGNAGLVDTWRRHRIANVGTGKAWLVVADHAGLPEPAHASPRLRVARDADGPMDPWEIEAALGAVMPDAPAAMGDDALRAALGRLVRVARAAWAAGACEPPDELRHAIDQVRAELALSGGERLRLRNGLGLADVLGQQVFEPLLGAGSTVAARDGDDPHFDRPVFIVSPPRAGSTMLFETLVRARGAVSIGDESHSLIEGLPALAPAVRGFASNRLGAADATPQVAMALRNRFLDQLRDRDGHRIDGIRRVRMLEKTPKNALRIPFLRAVFPEARFLYLHRDPRQVLASMIESWASGRFVTYPQLPGWHGPPWSLLLVPGWERLIDEPLDAIVGAQWAATMRTLLDDLDDVPQDHRLGVDYARLLADPTAELARICDWAGLDWDRPLDGSLPLSRYTVSAPDADKWRRHEDAVMRQLADHAELAARAAAAAG